MTEKPVTRAEALAKAREWAESAHRCYGRAASASQRRQDRDNTRFDIDRLTSITDFEFRSAATETALATAWAAIAAATPEEPQP
jgi:hypothetical protein